MRTLVNHSQADQKPACGSAFCFLKSGQSWTVLSNPLRMVSGFVSSGIDTTAKRAEATTLAPLERRPSKVLAMYRGSSRLTQCGKHAATN